MKKSIADVVSHLQENTITFSTNLLSRSKERIVFRPLKTKDQKQLIVSKDDNEKNELENFMTLIGLVDSCLIKNSIPLGDFAIEDFMSLLLEIKVKSLGETVELVAKCPHCGEKKNNIHLNFKDDVYRKSTESVSNNIVKIDDHIVLTLGFNTVDDFVEVIRFKEDDDRKVASYASMIKQVEFDGEILDELDIDQKIEIIGELSKEQLEIFPKFESDNKIEIKAEKTYKCSNPECEKENKVTLTVFNLISFF